MAQMLGGVLPSASGSSGKGCLLHTEDDAAVVDGGNLVGRGDQRLAVGIAGTPALDASDAIPRQHLGAVVEGQTRAQAQRPPPAVFLDDGALDHLRLRLIVAIDAEQRVEDEEAMVAGLIGGGPDRV
jgi:hypothetical protein